MMKLKEQAINELKILSPTALLQVYEFIHSIKGQEDKQKNNGVSNGYLKVRKALSGCQGSMSDDVIQERKERV